MRNFLSKIPNVREMTKGNLFIKILLFSLPAMLTTAMQLLYVTIDLWTVNKFDHPDSMGAIASNSALINLIVVVFSGIAIGANVILSQAKGANDKEKASKVLHSSLIFALITGIFVGALGYFISDNLLSLMKTEPQYFEKAASYLRIYFIGLPFLMVFNYEAQLLRAQGDSRSPFIALLLSGLLNVGADLLFVIKFEQGVKGVAYATIIAEFVSAAICFLVLRYQKSNYVSIKYKELRVDWKILLEVIKVGLPAGLQGFFFSLPNVFIQSSLYTISPGNVDLENGVSAANNIESYYHAGVDAIATSTMTYIAANVGAKNKDNIKKIILYGAFWGTLYCALCALIQLLFHDQILSIFASHEESLKAGYQRLCMTGYFYVLDFTMIFTAAILRGFKRSTYPMVTTLLFCTVLRIVLIYTLFPLEQFHNVTWLYALFPITWVLATISNLIALFFTLPKDLKKIDEELSLEKR